MFLFKLSYRTGVEIYIPTYWVARATPTSKSATPIHASATPQLRKYQLFAKRGSAVGFGGRPFDLRGPSIGLRGSRVGREALFLVGWSGGPFQNVSWQGIGLHGELPQNISRRGRTGSFSLRVQMNEAPWSLPRVSRRVQPQ